MTDFENVIRLHEGRGAAAPADGAEYRVAWESGIEGTQRYSVCDGCYRAGRWPTHWPAGTFRWGGRAEGIRPCMFCGVPMESPGRFRA